jgi:nucleotide-binding universal stress UspA family protein
VNQGMRILVAYDGSESSDIAIDGLQRAGLSSEGEALVVSVAEVWLPPATNGEADDIFPLQVPVVVIRARERAARIVEEAQQLAQRGSKRLQSILPNWKVNHEALSGSPAFEILNRADEWQQDLIVVGSQGRTAIGRLVLGSVSQKILTEAKVSVRIGRAPSGIGKSGERIVLAVDGSPGSKVAVKRVASRFWTPGSEVRVIVAQDLLRPYPTVPPLIPAINELIDDVNEAQRTQAGTIVAEAVKELTEKFQVKNVTVSSLVDSGDPKQVIIEQAKEFGADCIFTGASGYNNRLERFLLGSVSAAVAARAHCSVEVVRESQGGG